MAPIVEQSEQPEVYAIDYDKLYRAVAVAESTYKGKPCNTPWHKAANNCVSIMSWAGGRRHLKKFSSIEANKQEFKRIWIKGYGDHLPTLREAIKYTGNDKARGWLNNVKSYYFSH